MKLSVIALAILTLASHQAIAGLVITDLNGEVTLIEGSRVRVPEEDGFITWDGETSTITLVDTSEGRYAQGSVDELCRAMKSLWDAMLAEMPPEYRDQVTSVAMPEVTVQKVGPGEDVLGRATTRYRILLDGRVDEELWITADRELVAAASAVGTMFEGYFGCMPGTAGMARFSEPYRKLLQKGFPIQTVDYEDGVAGEKEAIRSFERRPIASSEFEPPRGLRKISLAEWAAAEMNGRE